MRQARQKEPSAKNTLSIELKKVLSIFKTKLNKVEYEFGFESIQIAEDSDIFTDKVLLTLPTSFLL